MWSVNVYCSMSLGSQEVTLCSVRLCHCSWLSYALVSSALRMKIMPAMWRWTTKKSYLFWDDNGCGPLSDPIYKAIFYCHCHVQFSYLCNVFLSWPFFPFRMLFINNWKHSKCQWPGCDNMCHCIEIGICGGEGARCNYMYLEYSTFIYKGIRWKCGALS